MQGKDKRSKNKNITAKKIYIIHITWLQVADNASVPVILYNMPGNTGIDIPIDVVVSLAKHPNIIGVKDSGGNVGYWVFLYIYKLYFVSFTYICSIYVI